MLESAGVEVHGVLGMYKGEMERSLMVMPGPHSAEVIRRLVTVAAQNFEQESVLEINREGHSWLLFVMKGTEEYMGKMVRVNSINPEKVSGYTAIDNGVYLALEHEVNGDE
jgi:hypothetical protein